MTPEEIANLPPEEGTPLLDYLENLQCLDTANSLGESEDFPTPSKNTSRTISKPSATATSTSRRSLPILENSPQSKSTEISETTTPEKKSSTLSPVPFLALGRVRQAIAQDLLTKHQDSGEKATESCAKPDPDISSGNNLWELSIEDLEQSLADAEWRDITRNLSRSQPKISEPPNSEKGFLSLPTLTTGTGTVRNAGRTKLESKLKTLGILPDGYQLSPEAMAEFMGFPWDWFEPITGQRFMRISGLFPTGYADVMMPEDLQAKPLPQLKRRSPLVSFSGGKKKTGRPKGSLGNPSGHLTPFVEIRKKKTYPVIEGERVDKSLAFDYPHHFNWFYQWGEWCDRREKWITKSQRVKPSKITTVRYLIQSKRKVDYVLHFIKTGKLYE